MLSDDLSQAVSPPCQKIGSSMYAVETGVLFSVEGKYTRMILWDRHMVTPHIWLNKKMPMLKSNIAIMRHNPLCGRADSRPPGFRCYLGFGTAMINH